MTTYRIPPLGRSVPTPISFQVERLESMEESRVFPDDADPAVVDAWRREVRARQIAELDDLEVTLLAAYGVKPRRPIKATPGPVAPPNVALSVVDGMTSETRHELRKAAMRLQELTREPVEFPAPNTEVAARDLLLQLRADVAAAEAKAEQPTPPDLVSAYAAPPAAQRVCSNVKAHGRDALHIDGRVYEYSVTRYGRPLCRGCQAAEPVRR